MLEEIFELLNISMVFLKKKVLLLNGYYRNLIIIIFTMFYS